MTTDVFYGIAATLYFCEREQCSHVDNRNLCGFFEFLMMHSFDHRLIDSPFRARFEPLSYYAVQRRCLANHWAKIVDPSEGWPQVGFLLPISVDTRESAHRRALEGLDEHDISWGDYKDGGSLDSLGLDAGQYYIGHCIELVRRTKPTALAFVECFSKVPEWSSLLEIRPRSVECNVGAVLSGSKQPRQGMSHQKFSRLCELIGDVLRKFEVSDSLESWDSHEFYKSLALDRTSRFYPSKRAVNLVSAAAALCFVALAGWRTSEYEFPTSSIVSKRNQDPLTERDQPLRHYVEWKIPKTHGEQIKRREITDQQHKYLQLLIGLRRPNAGTPCMTTSPLKWLPTRLGFQLTIPWGDFVENGEMPDALRERIRNELPYIRLVGEREALRKAIRNGDYSVRSNFNRELIESLISPDTRVALRSSDKNIADSTISQITYSLAQKDLLKPTPHGFRHIWAEAVLRRYDGDVGWFIRSQFSHISPTQWFAYVREKGGRTAFAAAATRVVSALLFKVIQSKGEGFAGPTAKAIRRIIARSRLVKPHDAAALEDFASDEIKSFSANPWGYCIVRKSAESRARCAEDKVSQPQNASDRLCLACPNFLTTTAHSSELLFIANTHAEIVLDQDIPNVFREESARAIRSATAYLNSFNIRLPSAVKTAVDSLAT